MPVPIPTRTLQAFAFTHPLLARLCNIADPITERAAEGGSSGRKQRLAGLTRCCSRGGVIAAVLEQCCSSLMATRYGMSQRARRLPPPLPACPAHLAVHASSSISPLPSPAHHTPNLPSAPPCSTSGWRPTRAVRSPSIAWSLNQPGGPQPGQHRWHVPPLGGTSRRPSSRPTCRRRSWRSGRPPQRGRAGRAAAELGVQQRGISRSLKCSTVGNILLPPGLHLCQDEGDLHLGHLMHCFVLVPPLPCVPRTF